MTTSGVTAALAGGRVEGSTKSEWTGLSGVLLVSDSSAGGGTCWPTGEYSVCECTVKTAVLSCAAVLLTRAQYMALHLNLPQLLLCMISWVHLGMRLSAILVRVDGAQFGVLEEIL